MSILHSNAQTHWDILSHQNLSDFMIIVDYSVLSYMFCNVLCRIQSNRVCVLVCVCEGEVERVRACLRA